MTSTDPASFEPELDGAGDSNKLRNRILLIILPIALIFMLGVVAGLTAVMLESGANAKQIITLLIALALNLGIALMIYRLTRGFRLDAVGPRTRRARNLVILSTLTGAVLGILFSLATIEHGDPGAFFSDAPISPLVAAIGTAIYALVIPLYSVHWWKSIDEHEAKSYSLAAVIALSLYTIAMPSWWMLWRGGWVTEPQDMTIFAVTLTVWGVAWMWLRSR